MPELEGTSLADGFTDSREGSFSATPLPLTMWYKPAAVLVSAAAFSFFNKLSVATSSTKKESA